MLSVDVYTDLCVCAGVLVCVCVCEGVTVKGESANNKKITAAKIRGERK